MDLGVYVSRIQPGSAAAREGTVAVGDRLLAVNGRGVERVSRLEEAEEVLALSAAAGGLVTITLAKPSSAHALSSSVAGGPLSSSSSGELPAAAITC